MSVIAAARPRPHPSTPSSSRARLTFSAVAREVGLVGALYLAYSASRVLADDDLEAAQARADQLIALQSSMHLDVESWLNQAVTATAWLAVPMDYWYSVLHYVVTPAALGWVFLRRRDEYTRVRNALAVASLLGLACYLLLPVAPPRLMDDPAYVDTLATYAHYGWWSDHASAPAGLGGMTNELAAMPSLHVGWALWTAWALCAPGRDGCRGRWQPLLYLYPAGTAVVVIATGNHWVMDAIAGLLVTVLGIAIANRLNRSACLHFSPSRRPAGRTAVRGKTGERA